MGPVAHGGHCVARHEGRVLFVRHALPGERVVAEVTEGCDGDRFLRADAVTVLTSSPDRVAPPCPLAGPGRCGGCDWQHASVAAQRRHKAEVIREQLSRLAGLDVDVVVEAVPGDDEGLGWRTRMQFAVGPDSHLGLRPHRSHRVLALTSCPIAHPAVEATGVLSQAWPGARAVDVVVAAGPGPDSGEQALVIAESDSRTRPALPQVDAALAVTGVRGGLQQLRGRTFVHELVAAGDWRHLFRVTGSGFWQVHPGAPAALVGAVLAALRPQPGEQVLDLYAGAGLFTAALAHAVAPQGAVLAIESNPHAVRDARHNLRDLPGAGVSRGRVERVLAAMLPSGLSADLVVLDPPRTGAGRAVVEQICSLRPRAVAYVACDPAALARDVAYAAEHGYRLAGVRGFDLFPMTQHVECVARLVPARTTPEQAAQ